MMVAQSFKRPQTCSVSDPSVKIMLRVRDQTSIVKGYKVCRPEMHVCGHDRVM